MDAQSEAVVADAAPSLATLVVVEDDADIGLALRWFLEEVIPCRVVLASDGFAALQVVRSLTPQLFLLDYALPGMTGLELVDALRVSPLLQQIPIILMSARMPRSGVTQRQVMAIQKPFDFYDLARLIQVQLPT